MEYILKDVKWVTEGPECGNKTRFNTRSRQVTKDFSEVWIECICGNDPTAENTETRYQDPWGGVHEDNVQVALKRWNDAINELDLQKKYQSYHPVYLPGTLEK